jgi:phosphoserine aminotransferase
MSRVFNFSAGPSILPLSVLKKVQNSLLSYEDTGMSVMEMSHRSQAFEDILSQCEQLHRQLMNIPTNYTILFLQGGASTQFSMIPLNLLRHSKVADYVNTGTWSKKAISEAKKYGDIRVVASSDDQNFSYIPKLNSDLFSDQADYIHITTNNTIEGTCFPEVPDTNDIPLVADMSSNILSQPYDVSKFGLIYAGAQKNIGPAGLTIVIIRNDLIGHASDSCPTMLNYQTHADTNSLYNTPPSFSIYVAKLVLEWLQELGGVQAIYEDNVKKANLLYSFLDHSDIFSSPVQNDSRSIMNIPFTTQSEEWNHQFLYEANKLGFVNLEGHRSVGGMRASLYNAMPIDGVEKLVEFMALYEKKLKELKSC